MDTRPGAIHIGPHNTLQPSQTVSLKLTGNFGGQTLPNEASAVMLVLTAVSPSAEGFLTLWPTGVPRPNASSLNFAAGVPAVANSVTVKLGNNGEVSIYNGSAGTTDVLVDLSGFFS
jgi:hypothetical protein